MQRAQPGGSLIAISFRLLSLISKARKAEFSKNEASLDGLVVMAPDWKSGASDSNPDRGTTLLILRIIMSIIAEKNSYLPI